jgi:hypothetical protein
VTYVYDVILRCRAFGVWSRGQWIGLLPNCHLDTHEGPRDGKLSFFVVSYSSQAQAFEGSDATSAASGLKLWKGTTPHGLLVGDRLFIVRGEAVRIPFELHSPAPNELDVGVHVTVSAPLEPRLLLLVCTPILYGLAVYLSFMLQDILMPAAPPQVFDVFENGDRMLHFGGLLQAFDRKQHSAGDIEGALRVYASEHAQMPENEAATVNIAARRYLSALVEADPVDRYCDLWEVCGFLSKNVKVNGDVVSRIAAVLAQHANKKKAQLEDNLRLRTIYKIRQDLVHNAYEDLQTVNAHLQTLEIIADELLRFRMKIAYEAQPLIEDAGSDRLP